MTFDALQEALSARTLLDSAAKLEPVHRWCNVRYGVPPASCCRQLLACDPSRPPGPRAQITSLVAGSAKITDLPVDLLDPSEGLALTAFGSHRLPGP